MWNCSDRQKFSVLLGFQKWGVWRYESLPCSNGNCGEVDWIKRVVSVFIFEERADCWKRPAEGEWNFEGIFSQGKV